MCVFVMRSGSGARDNWSGAGLQKVIQFKLNPIKLVLTVFARLRREAVDVALK